MKSKSYQKAFRFSIFKHWVPQSVLIVIWGTAQCFAGIELLSARYQISKTHVLLHEEFEAMIQIRGKKDFSNTEQILIYPKVLDHPSLHIHNISLEHTNKESLTSADRILFECTLTYTLKAKESGQTEIPAFSIAFTDTEAFFNTPRTRIRVHKDYISYFWWPIIIGLILMFSITQSIRFIKISPRRESSKSTEHEKRLYKQYRKIQGSRDWLPKFQRTFRRYLKRRSTILNRLTATQPQAQHITRIIHRITQLTTDQENTYYTQVLLDEEIKTLLYSIQRAEKKQKEKS